jgi:hypothetical protein
MITGVGKFCFICKSSNSSSVSSNLGVEGGLQKLLGPSSISTTFRPVLVLLDNEKMTSRVLTSLQRSLSQIR